MPGVARWPGRRPRPSLHTAPSGLEGARVSVQFQELVIECRIVAARTAYGRLRVEVTPVAGSGFQSVEAHRIIRAESPEVARRLGLA